MNVKNYTSSVPASTSINHIEKLLVDFGAHDINKKFKDKKLVSISFMITESGNTIPFKLPARVEAVEKIMKNEIRRPTSATFGRIAKQAERTAWKNVHEWLQIQLTMVMMGQVELIEVLLPHIYDFAKDESYFEKLKSKGFSKLLTDGKT